MVSDVDCKQNESTCSKKTTLSTNTVTQSIRHILILLFPVAQGPYCATKLTKINY